MKLINASYHVGEICKICDKIAIKQRRIDKEVGNIRRWAREGSRWKANIRKSEELIDQWEDDIAKYEQARKEKHSRLN